jgi:predicted ATP-binding protein involved in virulence
MNIETNLPPTRLDRLFLTNYRCFPFLDIELHPSLTVIVAPNGSGKTAILDAISVAWRLFVDTLLTKPNSVGFDHDDVRLQLSADRTMEPMLPISFAAKGHLAGSALHWSRTLDSDKPRAKTTFVEALDLKERAQALRAHISAYADNKRPDAPELPIVAYYGTGRLFGAHKLTRKKKSGGTSRILGYEDCLTSASRYKFFEDWFERFSREAQQEGTTAKQSAHNPREKLSAVARAVDALLAPSGWHGLAWDFAEDQIVATHPEHGTLPVSHLSDGIRNVIGMAGDIAHRCTRLNPHLGAAAARATNGIVMIDEVDMHLHPEWQQVVIQSLRDAFPLIQFIVTTHSPQVLTTVKSANIRVLRRDTDGKWQAVPPTQSPFARESKDALAYVMGVDPLPLKTEEQRGFQETIRSYEQLVRRGHKESGEARQLRAQIDAAGYEISSAELALWEFLGTRKQG